ncbi:SGNH/GDSL hydrolase family protein [Aspergillus mulundensis]|uniref:GDSL lipase/acylhydrolase family protein n=1 Tax=Aspergillus mulundensis TaxID=1810919 RepID=A0A3D8RK56_9EURO|nr:Uncharacterized protein DSM5745_07099 [Aspergillus mulundensis]RDW74437.1 Uncharacterized protein DSM5745_07099 [Aspergillus mulundensis]
MIMLPVFLLFLSAIAALAHRGRDSHWGPEKWKTLITFGNSYTDDSRLRYFAAHHGNPPPVGWEEPDSNDTFSGGYNWGHFASEIANVTRFNYAVSGAPCSNKITPRTYRPINAPYPSVLEYEIPAYLADTKYVDPDGNKLMDINANETVYAIWIGTNDVGNDAFLTDSQVNGTTIPDYVECVYKALDGMYADGARYFVIMNLVPLQLAPLYATPENGGQDSANGANVTEKSYRLWETVVTVNDVFRYKTPYEAVIARRYPGAQLAVMDMYGLVWEVYHNPNQYFDPPANVTGYVKHCNKTTGHCERLPNEHSFLWFDELHPSERTDQIVGQEFVNVVAGNSSFANYW